MLIRSVRLDNFRAVKSAKITFDRSTVLIGENDCGRSSIMEAVAHHRMLRCPKPYSGMPLTSSASRADPFPPYPSRRGVMTRSPSR